MDKVVISRGKCKFACPVGKNDSTGVQFVEKKQNNSPLISLINTKNKYIFYELIYDRKLFCIKSTNIRKHIDPAFDGLKK